MGNKRQVRHQRRTEDRLIIEVTNKGKAPLDSSKWKCNWINCIGGRGLSSSGFCSEGGDWGKKNCITFKAIPSPSPSEPAPQPETQPLEDDTLAAYAFVEQMIRRRVDKWDSNAPMWYGWALREAFKAGIEQQRQAIAASQPKCAERMPLLLTNPYFDNENPFASVWASGSREQRDADWQWHLADKAEAIKQFAEKCIEGMPKVHAACTCGQAQYDACIAHIRAMAEKEGEIHE